MRPKPPSSLDAHGKKKREGTTELPSALVRTRPDGRGALELSGIEVSRDSRSVQLVFKGLRLTRGFVPFLPFDSSRRTQGIKRNRTGQGSPPRARSARLGPGVIGVFRRAIRGPSHNRIPCDSLLYRRVQIDSLFIAGMIH